MVNPTNRKLVLYCWDTATGYCNRPTHTHTHTFTTRVHRSVIENDKICFLVWQWIIIMMMMMMMMVSMFDGNKFDWKCPLLPWCVCVCVCVGLLFAFWFWCSNPPPPLLPLFYLNRLVCIVHFLFHVKHQLKFSHLIDRMRLITHINNQPLYITIISIYLYI